MTTLFHPLFVEALEAIETLPADHPDLGRWLAQALDYAPEDLHETLRAKAQELGLYPDTPYRDSEGEPIFTCAQVAAHLGVPLEEVENVAVTVHEVHRVQ